MRTVRHSRGFTLTELAISMVILAFIFVFFLGSGSAFIQVRRTEAQKLKLLAIENAIAGYVSINGRLPCPADGSLPITNAAAGKEDGGVAGCNDSQRNGVVPWVTLGLSEADILDSWNNRTTYRVGNNLWLARAMDMTACDPAGTGVGDGTGASMLCQAACSPVDPSTCTPPTTFLQSGKGLSILDTAGITVMYSSPVTGPSGGAAYVLISHGRNGAGAFTQGGGTVLPTTISGDSEKLNANGVTVHSSYVDGTIRDEQSDVGTAAYFDDLVLRPSIMKVVLQAQRGPRSH